jgi:uncharacterized protein YndB with AHSA1/START domain
MTVVDKTPPAQSEFIAFELELAHAPAKVWRALTDPALLTEWLLPVVDQQLTLAAGSSFALKTEPKPGWDGRVDCRLIEVDPHRAISYSWVAGDMELDTVVTFTLTPTESGTRLTLVQSGFKPSQKQASGGARYGWRLMGGRLVDLLGRIS